MWPILAFCFQLLHLKTLAMILNFFLKKNPIVVEMNLWMVKLNDPMCINRVILGCFS